MAIKVPIVTEFNKSGLSDADRALRSFGVKSTTELKKAAAGFGILGAAGMAAFSELDKGYDAIVAGTGATGAALRGLKDDADAVARTVPNSFEQVGIAVAEVNTRLGLTGPAAQKMSKLFLDLARVAKVDVKDAIALTSRTFKDWSVNSEDQALVLDKLFAATQQSGVAIDKLNTSVVQFGAPLRQMGFSLEESIAMFAKFEAEGVNTEAVMSGLRQGLGKLSKAGEEPAEAFRRIVGEIKNVATTGQANALAIETFGQRAGPDMAAAIREGRFELDEMVDALGEAGGALETAAEETLSANDKFAMLRNQILVATGPAVEMLAEVGERLVDVFTLLPEPVQGAVVLLGALSVALKASGAAASAFGVKVKASAAATGLMGAAVGVAGVALVGYTLHSNQMAKANEKLTESISELGRTTDEEMGRAFTDAMVKAVFAGKDLESVLGDIARTSPGTTQRLLDLEDESGLLSETLAEAGVNGDEFDEILGGLKKSLEDEKLAVAQATATQERSNEIVDDATGASEQLTEATEDLTTAEITLGNRVREATGAIDQSIEASRTAREERRRLADGTYDARDAEDAFHDSVDRMILVQQSADSTEREKAASIRNSVKATDEMITKQLEEQGVIINSERGQREWADAMAKSAAFMGGPLGAEILAHIGRVNGIPEEKITEAQALVDMGSVDAARVLIDTELDKAQANPSVQPTGLEAARARIEAILGRRVDLSVNTYVPGGGNTYGGGYSRAAPTAARSAVAQQSQAFAPNNTGGATLVIQVMDGNTVRRTVNATIDERDAAALAEFGAELR